MGIIARLFGNNNASVDVNVIDGQAPTRDQFVIDDPVVDSNVYNSTIDTQLSAFERVVALSEIDHFDEAVHEVYRSNGALNLDSKLSELKMVFKNATFESMEVLKERILVLEQHEALCNSHDQYEQALQCVTQRTSIQRKVERLSQALVEADAGQGMVVKILESYKRGFFYAKGQLLNSINQQYE